MKKIVIISLISIILFSTNIYAYNYNINDENTEDQLKCWVGWKKYHYGNVDELAKKGQSFDIPGSPIIKKHEDGTTEYHEGQSYKITTNGYGYYSLDFEKHVLALLSYIKKNIATVENYDTNYKPTENSTLVEDIEYNADGTVKLEDALRIAMNGMVSNWYSESYEKDEFEKFWKGTFIDSHRDNLRKIQNKFYWDVYGESAYNKLISMMSGYKLNSIQKQVLKGVVFSIMEARYRNKNVQGKMNLRIKAAEGELWPFLVNLKNLKNIEYDNVTHTYIDITKGYTYYEWPEFDELIEGAYQWMIYHDADTIRTTSHRTITKTISDINGKEEEDVEIDWESEFSDLTWDYLPALNGKELEKFYTNCQLVKSIFKKSAENTMGFFGAEELYDITSEKNFSEAIRDMKDAMQKFCGEGTMDSVWTGLTDYNMERTYIMAKNIVETNRVKDEFAYYNIGTNIITYTYGRHGKEYMLMDLQRIKLEEALKDKDDQWIEYDTDGDGIFDKDELGDNDSNPNDESTMWKKVDITKFIKKAVEKELYGNDTKEINSDEGKLMVNTALAQVKYNVYKERQQFPIDHPDNECDRKEDKENYLNIDSVTEGIVKEKTDIEIREEMKKDSAKLQVRLWKYKSNPVLKDTDFDGINDNTDKVPKSNFFTGKMHTTRLSGDDAIEVDMNMDYRYFFMSNKLYFDELSTMSLLYANSIYRRGRDQDDKWMKFHSGIVIENDNNITNILNENNQCDEFENPINNRVEYMTINEKNYKNLKIKDMMLFFGFKNVKTYYMGEEGLNKDTDPYNPADISDECRGYKDTHKGRVAIGYKNIEYHGLKKTVIGIVIRGTAEDDDWDSDFDMGDKELRDKLENIESGKNNYDKNYNNILMQLSNGILDKYDKNYAKELLHFAGGYPDWIWDYHHAGFDIVSNRILEVLDEYITTYSTNFKGERCFWVTGHSMGGGVANLVAASLVYGECGGNADNVYCYTFASPNTFYRTDSHYEKLTEIIPGENVTGKYAEPKGIKYRCIFNIVNDDDFVPKLPMEECEWTKYGRVAKLSITNEIYNRCINTVKLYDYQTSHYSRPIGNPSDARYSFDMIKMPYMNYVTKKYSTNIFAINTIISSFNSMFTDKTNMRNEAYRYVDNYVDYAENEDTLEKGLGFYSKVYQKYNILNAEIRIRTSRKTKDSVSIPIKIKRQYQMPAFVMQNVANAVHAKVPEWKERNGIREIEIRNQNEGIERNVGPFNIELKENEAVLFDAKFAKWGMFVSKWSMLIGEGKLKAIDYPHYLESYYTLSKEITTTDFR